MRAGKMVIAKKVLEGNKNEKITTKDTSTKKKEKIVAVK